MKLKKLLGYFLEIMILVIVGIMMISTFIPLNRPTKFYTNHYSPIISKLILSLNLNNFYASAINISLWLVFCLLLFVFIINGMFKRKKTLALHLIIFLITLIVFYDKAFNTKYFLELREGESINLSKFLHESSKKYDFDFRLIDFNVRYHSASNLPSAFISTVELKDSLRRKIAVNKPLTIGDYKFYQNTYHTLDRFHVQIDSVLYTYTSRDTLIVDSLNLQINKTIPMEKTVKLILNGREYRIDMNTEFDLAEHKIKISSAEPIYVSGLQISRIYGMKILFLLSILFIINLAWCFWGEKHEI